MATFLRYAPVLGMYLRAYSPKRRSTGNAIRTAETCGRQWGFAYAGRYELWYNLLADSANFVAAPWICAGISSAVLLLLMCLITYAYRSSTYAGYAPNSSYSAATKVAITTFTIFTL